VADPHRPGHEQTYHPGEANVRMADIVVINKVDTADNANVAVVHENIRALNPRAIIINAASPIAVEDGAAIVGKSVIVVEDGPTLTHGEMAYGAGVVAARKYHAREIIDPRPYAVGAIKATYDKYPSTGAVLPAMGYGAEQTRDLEQTIRNSPAEMVIIATPIDLRRVIKIDKPSQRVSYELEEIGHPTLAEALKRKLGAKK
jgi:predicted GTPase